MNSSFPPFSIEMTKLSLDICCTVSQLALASILAMVDSRSKMLFIVLPIYTRILLPICALVPILVLATPPQSVNNTKVDLDPTYTTTAILFGLIYWKLGLRGKQFA